MVVYHGTDSSSADNILKNGIDVKYGEDSVDNGKGFYMTPSFEFAFQRAETTTLRHKSFHNDDVKPVVLKIELDLPDENSDIKVKQFNQCTYEWKEFIFFNRIGMRFINKWKIETDNHNLDFKYDIVIDETADNEINTIISNMRYAKDISNMKKEIGNIQISSKSYWDKQISVHTQKACSCISSIEICEKNTDK